MTRRSTSPLLLLLQAFPIHPCRSRVRFAAFTGAKLIRRKYILFDWRCINQEWKGEEERRENMAECSGRDPEIFQLSKKTKSDVWPYFGFYKKAEGKLIEDDHRLQDMPKENSSERGKRIKPYESPLRPPPATF